MKASISPLNTMSPQEIAFEVSRGGRFVVFQYCVSIVIITFRRNSGILFVPAGSSVAAKSLPYTLLSLVLGWWGFPWGFIYTPMVIYKNLNGGTDVTPQIMARFQQAVPPTLPVFHSSFQ